MTEEQIVGDDGKVEIEIEEGTWKKAKRLGDHIGQSPDEVVEHAIQKELDKEENLDRYFPDEESRDNFERITEPFERLKKGVNLNFTVLEEDAEFPAIQKFHHLSLVSYEGFLRGIDSMFIHQAKKMQSGEDKSDTALLTKIGRILEEAKVFNIDEELSELIENTNNKPHYSRLPFRLLFINKELEPIKGVHIFGIGISKVDVYTSDDKSDIQEGMEIVFVGSDYRDDSEFYQYFSITKKGIAGKGKLKGGFNKGEGEIMMNKVANFVTNFLDLLNHPDIEYEVVSYGKEQNREKRGKLRINDKVNIVVKGKLYRYVYDTLPQQQRSYTHRFWVRGHFKHFRNRDRFHQIYGLSDDRLALKGYQIANGVICKWALPYIKGHGRLREKEYKLKQK